MNKITIKRGMNVENAQTDGTLKKVQLSAQDVALNVKLVIGVNVMSVFLIIIFFHILI